MRCIRPLKASQRDDHSITFSMKEAIPGLQPFQIECRKCLPCRLNQAREKAIRCYHEAKMHEDNIFLTLTYNEESLDSPKLNYKHFQDFMKRLRERYPEKITYMVTGEYGEKNKRPHWHAIIFNLNAELLSHEMQLPRPELLRTTELGERVYVSEAIQQLWSMGNTEYGSVTMDSASYVARYAAKKLTHGKDQEHDYHPIHKTSSKKAIGRTWLEANYIHTFQNGFVVINGTQMKIPRYYVDWVKKHHPDIWLTYVTEVRPKIIKLAEQAQIKEDIEFQLQLELQKALKGRYLRPKTKKNVKETILKSKFKRLQENLKL